MFDFADWIRRAEEFVNNLEPTYDKSGFGFIKEATIHPPLSSPDISHLESLLLLRLPPALIDFYSQGSRCCQCSYNWIVSPEEFDKTEHILGKGGAYTGGATFFDAFELVEHIQFYRQGWISQVFADYPEETRLRQNALPIVDAHYHLALDLSDESDDPPVFWMHPESFSQRIAPSFTQFLTAWEELYYIGPRIEELGEFLATDTGTIDTQSQKAKDLQALFQPHIQSRD